MRRGTRLAVGALLWLCAGAGCEDDPCTTCTDDAIHGVARYFDGAPMMGVQVEVTGKPAVNTGIDGSFTVRGVTPPYDITLQAPFVQVWRGLTRRDPVLYSITGGQPQGIVGAQISGQVPISPDQFALVFFVAPKTQRSTRADQLTGRYSFEPEWLEGSPDPVGKLYVLRGTAGTAGLPIEYDGWGAKDLTLSPGTPAVRDFAPGDLVDPAQAPITGHVTLPAGFELDDFLLNLKIDAQSVEILYAPQAVNSSGDFELKVPVIASTSFQIYANAYAQGDARRGYSQAIADGLHPNSQEVALTLRRPPVLQSPPASATGVDATTTFSWTPGSGQGVHLYVLRSGDFRTNLYVIQAGASLRWMDLPAAAFRPWGEADYRWYVRQLEPVPDIDMAAAPGFVPILFGQQDDAGSEVRDLRTRQ